jgi:hypothetical protein
MCFIKHRFIKIISLQPTTISTTYGTNTLVYPLSLSIRFVSSRLRNYSFTVYFLSSILFYLLLCIVGYRCA